MLRWSLGLLAGLAGLASPATVHATWSIILVDVRTGEIAVGSATCLTGFDLRANTPVILTGIGAATAQSSVDTNGFNRATIRDAFAAFQPPTQILQRLASSDASHQSRQYGLLDTLARPLTFTGNLAGPWAGGITGRVGDIAYAVQGNVLTGPCVVDQAIQAALATATDLPGKLMAAMEAARAAGGDGRCSCTPDGADACGCPPSTFTKSSHIAYMLVARANDRDGCDGLYRGSTAFSTLAIADFTGDGRPDLGVNTSSPGAAFLFRNTTPNAASDLAARPSPPLRPTPSFASPTQLSGPAIPRAIATGDLDGDGLPELVTANTAPNQIAVYRPQASGTWASRTDISLSGVPAALAIARFTASGRRDIATNTANRVVLLRNDAGLAFTTILGPTLNDGTSITALAVADVNADNAPDLVAAMTGTSSLAVLTNDGAGSFTRQSDIAVGGTPAGLVSADWNADGRPDLAVILGTQRSLRIFTRTDTGYALQSFTLPVTPTRLLTDDLNADGRPDLLVLTGDRVYAYLNTPGGVFVAGPVSTFTSATSNVALGDLNGDGAPDLASSTSAGVTVAMNRGDASFPSNNGYATGDYYLTLNIANAAAADPDPVAQLRTQFDAWRTTLPGKPDAVRSRVAFSRACIAADTVSTVTATIDPRDYTDTRTANPLSVRVAHAPGSARRSTIGPVTANPDGTYSFTLSAAQAPGLDRLLITLDDGLRPVTLMPYPSVVAANSTDYNRDGTTDLDDLGDFVADFYTQPPIPGGLQPDAPNFPDRAVGYGQPCSQAPDAPAPYAVDAYRANGFRTGFSPDGSALSICPPSPPNLDNLGDFISAFYNTPDRCPP
jgi:uncharacterized Ntn-hydrolase superfamily protein